MAPAISQGKALSVLPERISRGGRGSKRNQNLQLDAVEAVVAMPIEANETVSDHYFCTWLVFGRN